MTSPETLARLTAASAWKIERLDHGVSDLDPALLAAALPSDHLQRAIIMAAYMGDENAIKEARNYFYTRVVDEVRFRRWDVPPGIQIYRAMATVAIHEVIRPAICQHCQGLTVPGEKATQICGRVIGGQPVACPVCGGGGIKAMSTDDVYTALQMLPPNIYDRLHEITESHWRRKWRHRYGHIYSLAIHAHNEGAWKVREAMQ